MKTDVISLFKKWIKNERKAIQQTYGRSRGDFERGLRAELNAVESAFLKACNGQLDDNG